MRFTRMLVLGVAVVGITALSAAAADVNLYTEAWAIDCDPLSATPGARTLLTSCELPADENCVVLPMTSGAGTPEAKAMYEIFFQVAVGVDPLAGHALGNLGLATIVYDVMPNECMTCGCPDVYFNAMTDANSGWSDTPGFPALNVVSAPMYTNSGTTAYPGYNGGWGFDNAQLPTGGNTDTVQEIHGAGMLAPLTWQADVNPIHDGLQPYVRQGVGHGIYTFPAADPIVGGMQGGFGQVLDNTGTGGPILPGDGHWLLQEGLLPCTANWEAGCCYGWDVDPSTAAVYTPTMDYNSDIGGGFRIAIPGANLEGDSFCFCIIPEPASIGLLLIGGLSLIRRRR